MPSFPPPPSPSAAGFSPHGRSTNGTGSGGGHQRHQSTSSLSPLSVAANHLQGYNNHQQLSIERRLWVKRPQGTPTTLKVRDGDIVDDLKTMVLMKYPTTLARTCDPADVNLTFVRDGKTITLLPDELVFKFLDRYFPGGMNMHDALTLEQVPTVALAAGTTATPPALITTTLEPTYTTHLTTVAEAPILEATSAEHQPSFTPPAPSTRPHAHGSISSGVTAQSPRPPLFHQNSSYGNSNTVKTSSPNNGVLLLPRQFQLPKGSPGTEEKKNEDTLRRRSADEGTGDEPGGITLAEEDAAASKINDAFAKEEISSNDKHLHSPTKAQPNGSRNVPVAADETTGPRKPGEQKNLEKVVPQINMLIVEDNVINQKILEQFMKRKKIRSSVAKNGREAVDKWRQGGFHLILMDIQLPVMSGIEATKEIRRLELVNKIGVFSQTSAVPSPSKEDLLDSKVFRSPVIIVALTASSTMMDKNEALAAGCNDFLTKPVNLQWLEQKTIEWGCMQALIDFEGWKNWLDRDGKVNSTTTTTTTTTTNSLSTALASHRPRSRSRSRSSSRSRNSIRRVGSGGSSGKSPLTKEITAPTALTPLSPVSANK